MPQSCREEARKSLRSIVEHDQNESAVDRTFLLLFYSETWVCALPEQVLALARKNISFFVQVLYITQG